MILFKDILPYFVSPDKFYLSDPLSQKVKQQLALGVTSEAGLLCFMTVYS